jgi:hypothetical protein
VIAFLHPWVLLGLPLAAVPLLLHLVTRRDPPTVEFPAVRYLVQVTREHSRRLRLRHWLLLAVRTLLVLALVLAAAGPTAPLGEAASHAPSALALVLDNSPSSGAVVGGAPRLVALEAAARRILEAATPGDALWLVTADAPVRRGTREELLDAVDRLEVSDRRLDLGEAVALAGAVVRADPRPGAVALLSDLQATALGPAEPAVPLVVVRPAEPPPPNMGLARIAAGPQPWTPDGGTVTVEAVGDPGRAVPVSVQLAARPPRQALVAPGAAAAVPVPGTLPGWWLLRAAKDPDELRSDDERIGVVRIAPVAAVRWSDRDRFVSAAAQVLESGGRLRRGAEVTLGDFGPGASVIWPPADAAEAGALNRALAGRGSAWRFGALLETASETDSGPLVGRERIARRYTLEYTRGGPPQGVIATAGGTPWLVRSGDLVLVASRLEPEWTDLPVSTRFVAFLDALVNRVSRGELVLQDAAPGDPVPLPDQADAVVGGGGDRRWDVEGGAAFRPPAVGVYYVLADRDTIGAITANLDPRESILAPAAVGAIRALWRGARVVQPGQAAGAAFAGAGRASLQGPLLWAALLLGMVEVALASGGRRRG